MTPAYLFYNTVASLAAPPLVALAAARGRLRGAWPQRLGLVPRLPRAPGPRVWVHAVSVGEAQVAAALVKALQREAGELRPFVTTTTASGREAAQDLLGPDVSVLTFPLDVYGSPARALKRLRPDLVILLETELWPNFLRAAKNHGARTMLANGRISLRSAPRYRRFAFLLREVLACLDLMAMIRAEDRARILSLGADPGRVVVAGSAKYDLLLARADADRAAGLARELGLAPDQPVLVAGSTRSGEELAVLEVFQRLRRDFPRLHLILAPRHLDRVGEIAAMIRARGLTLTRRSRGALPEGFHPEVTLVDVMGQLFFLYSLATVAFCGASLVPLGGQNPLEAAVWAKPVLYGPFMDDFLDAKDLLEGSGAGQTVRSRNELWARARELLTDPDEAQRRGRAGRAALEAHQGASARLAGLALDLLALDKKEAT